MFNRTRLRPLGAVLLTVIAVLTLFQNCGTYEPANNPLFSTSTTATCTGASCTQDLNYLALYIGNPEPVLVVRTTETAVDFGGYCDTAGYPDNRIYVELKNGTTTVLGPYLSTTKCDANGRFQVLLTFPGGYNYNLAYSAVLTLRAVDTAGNEYDHPTGVNRREIAILTAP